MGAIIPQNVELLFDPGHGGVDPGAVKYGREEDWTLKIALYQFERAKELGIKAGITRTTDEDLPEDKRVALVKNSGAKYCFSDHLNAGGGDRAEIIHSIYDDGKLANLIKEEMLAVGQTAVKVYCKSGKNGDYYYMHRRTGAVKVNIVEYAFIDNQADYDHFVANWEAYAEAPLKAYCRHTGHIYKPRTQATLKGADNVADIRYIYTGGYAGPALQEVHTYLFTTGHNFDCKRAGQGSIVFLIGRFDTSQANFKDCENFLKKGGHTYKVITEEEAAKFR